MVSIIIPLYNRENLILETLESIKVQTYSNFECIIVDDGSTDNGIKLVKNFLNDDNRFKLFERPSNVKKGGNSCRNIGFLKSSGEYIHWFDSDDIMEPRMIENKTKVLQTNDADIVICRMANFIGNKKNIIESSEKNIEHISSNPAFELISRNYRVQTSQVIFLRSFILSQNVLFNTKLTRNQETEYFVRLFLVSPRIYYINSTDVLVRLAHLSISSHFDSLNEGEKYLVSFVGYLEMFKSFKKANKLSEEIKIFFARFFYNCLKKMKVEFWSYPQLYIYGIFNNWFPSLILSFKIFSNRYFFKN